MSEEVKNEENDSKKKWLWLLLLLLLIVFVVFAVILFLKDNGTAEATDGISEEISQEEEKTNEAAEESGISSNEKTQKLVVAANENLLATAIAPTGTSTSITEKIPVTVNVLDNSFFNEPVVLEITGEDFTATITDSNGNVSNYEGKATLSEDGKYTLTIKDSDGTEKTVSFTIDTTNPSITGVEDGKLYNTEVTPIIEELNIDKIVLTKDGSETEYNSGDAITEDGEYILEVIDKAGNSAAISFVIDVTVPKLALNGDAKIKIEAGIDTYTELGATVTDNYDETIANLQPKFINYSINGVYQGKVSSVDNKKLGTYKIVYECTDKAGNIGLDASRDDHAYVMRVVEVVDTTKPVITLNGESVINHLEKGVETYTEVGAISTDNYDTTQTIDKPSYINLYVLNSEGQYAFSGRVPSVDTKVVGRYNLVYTDVDSNGNEAVKVTRMVFVKDTIAPTATIEYSTTEVTNKDVVVTLKADENVVISDAETWTPASGFGTIFNKSYVKNTTQIITITDESGNTNTVEVKIQNIDKTAPTAINIEYSTEKLTNGSVVVTITATEPLYSHPGWKKGNRAYKITKTFTENTEETVMLKDKAGNITPITVKVTNIDKVAPTLTVKPDSAGKDPSYRTINFKLSDNRLIDKFEVNGIMRDVSNSQWGDANYDVLASLVREGENTIVLYDVAGNKTVRNFVMDRIAPVVTVESVVERVEDADGNWIDVKGGQRLIANEDVEIVNEPALVPVNGSAREYEITYSLFNPTHAGYHFINVIVRDKAGNETTADVEIFIPEYSTSNVSTTSNLNSTSLRMTKAAPKTAAVQTNTAPVVIEQEDNNDKSDDPIQDDLLTTDEKKDDANVIPADSIVDDKKDNQVTMETDIIPEDKKETIPTQPDVDNVQNNIPTEPVIETPVVEEPKTEATPAPVEEVVEEPVITESEILDPVVTE